MIQIMCNKTSILNQKTPWYKTFICKKGEQTFVFDISCDCNFDFLFHKFDSAFDVDPLIATCIKILNDKGYSTEMSCSEHFCKRLNCEELDTNELPQNILYKQEKDDNLCDCYYIEECRPQHSSIRFCKKYNFKSLPLDWKFSDDCFLYFSYPSTLSEYEFYKLQAEAMYNLYNWANELPNISQ
ncbi:MAG: hypothetical protein IJZ83_00580 [Clostridia bacterium]|nr:hypothetical protein [Clostridia bacterium]